MAPYPRSGECDFIRDFDVERPKFGVSRQSRGFKADEGRARSLQEDGEAPHNSLGRKPVLKLAPVLNLTLGKLSNLSVVFVVQ